VGAAEALSFSLPPVSGLLALQQVRHLVHPPIRHHPVDANRRHDVLERIPGDHDQVRELPRFDRAGVEMQGLGRVYGRGLQRLERGHAGQDIGLDLGVKVGGIRRIGTGYDPRAGSLHVDDHLPDVAHTRGGASAAATSTPASATGAPAAATSPATTAGAPAAGDLAAQPPGVEPEARVGPERRVGVEHPAQRRAA
jgi:hypothetical protein